jgi:hypothetical protein
MSREGRREHRRDDGAKLAATVGAGGSIATT